MNVLLIGSDPTIFQTGKAVFGDTRKRHLAYARQLREVCGPASQIRMMAYTPRGADYRVRELADGLTLYPTRSFHRVTFLPDLARLLPTVLHRWKPDIISPQGPWEEGTLAFFLARWLGAKYVPQLHADIFTESWRREHWLNPWRFFLGSRLIRAADGVRVVSQGLKRHVVARLGVAEEKVGVVPLGVNFTPVDPRTPKEDFKKQIASQLSGRKTVLFVGRFCAAKNLELWVEVAQMVAQRQPGVAFLMAGHGSLLPQIQQLVEEKGLADRFHFLGSVGHEKLPEVYAAADVFLLTSHYEGYGRVIVEAYLAGVPVVSSRSGGPEDIVRTGVDGFLTAQPHELADAVLGLLADPEKAARMGQAGQARMREEFSLEVLVPRLVGCWVKACGHERQRAGKNFADAAAANEVRP